MPELVDVEGFRRVLAEHALNKPVRRVRVADAQVVRGTSGRAFADAVRGHRFTKCERHGKWLVAPLSGSDAAVLLHFGMTGQLHWAEPDEPSHRHDRVVFELDGGELRYRDQRKLAGLRLARSADDRRQVLGELGPDARDVTESDLRDRLCGKRAQLKSALLDQAVLAGLGNLLADETLWQAKLHPKARADRLSASEYRRLHRSMRKVLEQSIPESRVPPRDAWLTGHRDDPSGQCPRCRTRLSSGKAGGRRTVWCPRCQPTPELELT